MQSNSNTTPTIKIGTQKAVVRKLESMQIH